MPRRRLVAHNGMPFVGGGELWTIRLLQELGRRGHDVEMWVRDRNVREQVRALGVAAEVAHLGGPLMIPEALALGLKLQKNPPDALLLTTFKKAWLGGLGGRLAGVPRVVLRIGRASDLPRRNWTYGVALRRWIDAVVTNSRSIRDDVRGDLPGLPAEHIRTIWNGVVIPEEPPRGTVRRELGLSPDVPVVGTVGRLEREKGQARLIQAVSELDGVHCVLAGDGSERGNFEALARTLDTEDRIHFLGHRPDVTPVLADLDLYVVPSDVEGMSNAMLEAMAVGVPVLSTPVSGAADALEPMADGEAPGLIASPDPVAFREALGNLLDDAGLRARMAGAAKRRVRNRFDAGARADDWEALLFGGPTSPPT